MEGVGDACLRADLTVVDGPETMEAKGFLVAVMMLALSPLVSPRKEWEHTIHKSDPSHPNPGSQHSDQSG